MSVTGTTSVGTSFLHAMGGKPAVPVPAGKTLTENGALSLASTGMARVDLFFKMCRKISEEQLVSLLEKSWAEDALDTLRIVFNARDCRGGKGERALFRRAMQWMASTHPETVLCNMKHVPEFGRWEDLIWFMEFGPAFEERACQMFAKQLKADRAAMMRGDVVTLCAKWAPTERGKHDKLFHAAAKIRQRMGELTPAQYRKQYLTPLRTYLKVVEHYMCAKEWESIDYSTVPSCAMNRLKKAFARNDAGRFEEWKMALTSDNPEVRKTVKVNARQLFPHDLVRQYMNGHAKDVVIEEQWKELLKKGVALKDSIVLSDVSGSMYGTPMEVSIALGIYISPLVAEPFRNQVITFETSPRFHHLTEETLKEKVNQLASAPWGGSTDFQAVFNLILERALGYEDSTHGKVKVRDPVPADQMPKQLFVLSDMQFNHAGGSGFLTNYETIRAKYAAVGYQLPVIVFWNLRGNTNDFTTNALEQGVSMVSGFSPDLLKAVIEGKDMTPYGTLRAALDSERYSVLRLTDEEVISL